MDASHLNGRVSGEVCEAVDPPGRRHQSAQGGRCSVFTGNRRVRHESYRGWSGYRKAGVCATCRSLEFLFYRSNGLMKPVVPSTVPYPDMRSR